jgi:hypothetical protein
MAKTLDAILAAARERISGANYSAGRNTGSEQPTTTGKEPGVDYAPRAGGERKFIAKHTHIEQEYPTGMEHAFTGEPVKYALDDPRNAHYGNKAGEAQKAYEEVITQEQFDDLTEEEQASYELTEVSKEKLNKYRQAAHDDAKQSIARGQTQKYARYNKRAKGLQSAFAKVTGRAKVNATEEVEQVDELSIDKMKAYHKKSSASSAAIKADKSKRSAKDIKKFLNRGDGQDRAERRIGKKVIAQEETDIDEAHPMDHKNRHGMTVNHTTSNRIAKIHGDLKVPPKEYNAHKEPSKASQRSAASAAVAAYLAKGKRVHKEEVEQVDEAGVRNLRQASRTFNVSKAKINQDRKPPKAMPPAGPSKADQRASASAAVAAYLAKGKQIHKEEIEADMDVVEGVLTDKSSLGRKMVYHKAKMSNEDIGSVKFRHHQKQIHIIKGMLEEVEVDEAKTDQGYVYKKDKHGFLVKKRRYGKDNKKEPKRTWEETEQPAPVTESIDPQVARIAAHMDKEKF